MVWFLHAVELLGGAWACRWGRHQYDVHPSLEGAAAHLREMAAEHGPTELYAHHLDGRVARLGTTDVSPHRLTRMKRQL
jgi:hypothetical protein